MVSMSNVSIRKTNLASSIAESVKQPAESMYSRAADKISSTLFSSDIRDSVLLTVEEFKYLPASLMDDRLPEESNVEQKI